VPPKLERPGAPRCPAEERCDRRLGAKGFVNLALLKGYQFSFESSSDHTSTHISYAMVLRRGPFPRRGGGRDEAAAHLRGDR